MKKFIRGPMCHKPTPQGKRGNATLFAAKEKPGNQHYDPGSCSANKNTK